MIASGHRSQVHLLLLSIVFFLLSLVIMGVLTWIVTAAEADTLKLSWDPNQEADLAGYGIYVSEQSGGPYTLADTIIKPADPTLPIPSEYMWNVPDGTDKQWFFVVDAFDMAGNRSGKSNEAASDRIDLLPPVPPGGLRVIRLAPGEGAVIILPPSLSAK